MCLYKTRMHIRHACVFNIPVTVGSHNPIQVHRRMHVHTHLHTYMQSRRDMPARHCPQR